MRIKFFQWLFFVAVVSVSLFARNAYAATVIVTCSGTSGSPTAVTEADLNADDVTFSDGGGDGYCVLDQPISAASVVVDTGVVITHTAQDADGVTITTTGDFMLIGDIIVDEKGCPSTQSPNGSNVCSNGGGGAGNGEGQDGGNNNGGGGAGHGGAGGNGNSTAVGGNSYDSSTNPVLFGSGGGQYDATRKGGAGGGLVLLNVTGTLTLNGVISADGGVGDIGSTYIAGGGGSGGTINLTAGHLAGSGTAAANGGAGGNNATADGGGGAGGRIAVLYTTSSMSISSATFPMTGGSGPDTATDGPNGTVYVHDVTNDSTYIFNGFGYGSDISDSTWIVDSSATNQFCDSTDATPSITTTGILTLKGALNCTNSAITGFTLVAGDSISLDGFSFTMTGQDVFTINSAVDLTLTNNTTITSNVNWTNLTNLTIDFGSSIIADALGCTTSKSPNGSNVCSSTSAGAGNGEGQDGGNNNGGGGAGHGGAGGNGNSTAVGGNSYDSSTNPVLVGSGGGHYTTTQAVGGTGGGVIILNVSGTTTLNGDLSVDGTDGSIWNTYTAGGGGSGGSINITTGTFAGTTGTLTAQGGAGGDNSTADGGGGGGGIVAFNYGGDSSSYLGGLAAATVAAGGAGPGSAADGAVGIVSKVQVVAIDSITITDNSGYTNDSTPVITVSQVGATPTHVAFSCDAGANWSSWIAYPDDDVVNDGDGPAFDVTSGATGCSANEELKTISAKIKDASSESSTVSDTTTYDITAPTVSGVSATNANATYGVDDVITATVQFNDNMSVTGTPQLQLDMDGTDRLANYTSTSTNTLSFVYTIVVGDNKADLDYTSTSALSLNDGTISDLAGNTATLTLATPGAAGSLGANKNIVIVTNQAPTVSTVTAVQGTDGTGDVTITFIMDDPDNDDTLQAKIEYSLNGGSTWADPTLSVTGSETFATYGDPSIDNAQMYQVGQSGAYITTSSGANTVSIVWESASDVLSTTDISNAQIRVTPFDSIATGSASTSSNFILDLVSPTGLANLTQGSVSTTQGTLNWTAATDTNFNHYEIWYGSVQTDAENRTGGAVEWDDSDSGSLATASTATTTVVGNLKNKYITIFAVDDFGNALTTSTLHIMGTSSSSLTTNNDGTVSLTYTIDVTSPTSGAFYASNAPVRITWTTGGTGTYNYIDLYASTDGVNYSRIAHAVDALNQSYTWIPIGVSGSSVTVRADATDLVDVMATDISSTFTIASTPTTTVPTTPTVAPTTRPQSNGTRVSSSQDIPTGAFFKGDSWATVYYVDENRVRHPFLDAQTYFTYADSFDGLYNADDEVLRDFTLGAPMLPKAGVVLIKVQSVPKVYLMDETGALRWIISEDVATALYGAAWADYVIDVPPTAWSHFTIGADVDSAGAVTVDRSLLKERSALGG